MGIRWRDRHCSVGREPSYGLHTDLPAGEANNAVNWFLDRDRDRDQGKEKLLEGIIIRRRRKKKEISSECEKPQWK